MINPSDLRYHQFQSEIVSVRVECCCGYVEDFRDILRSDAWALGLRGKCLRCNSSLGVTYIDKKQVS